MNVTIVNGQIALSLSDPQEIELIRVAAIHYADRLADAEILARTYHLGGEPTKGRGYDDRLTMRTGYSRSTLLPLLQNGIGKKLEYGVLVGLCAVNKWMVSEQAVRAYFGVDNVL